VEVQVAGLAAQRALPADLELLNRICDDHERSLKSGDLAAAAELDFQFHRELTRSSGNELLLAMLDSIADVLREVRNQSMTEPHVGDDGLRAHRRILKAIRSGKPDAARLAMIEHLAEAEKIWRGVKAQENKAAAKKAKRVSK
jgi:GntR family transcriptional repressor for pyruvate dehydrogenase complex